MGFSWGSIGGAFKGAGKAVGGAAKSAGRAAGKAASEGLEWSAAAGAKASNKMLDLQLKAMEKGGASPEALDLYRSEFKVEPFNWREPLKNTSYMVGLGSKDEEERKRRQRENLKIGYEGGFDAFLRGRKG